MNAVHLALTGVSTCDEHGNVVYGDSILTAHVT